MYIYIPFQDRIKHGVYGKAVEQAFQGLRKRDPYEAAQLTGTIYDEKRGVFMVPLYNHQMEVTFPAGIVTFADTEYYPPTALWIIVLNYLGRGDGTPLTEEFIPYRLLPDGQVFDSAFYNMAIKPVIRHYGHRGAELTGRAALYGGERIKDGADLSFVFNVLPRMNLKLRLWEGDDELPPSANMLFSASASHYLHTEDLSVVGSFLSNLLVGGWQAGSF